MSRRLIFFVSHSSAGGAQAIWANLAGAFRGRGYDVQLAALYPLRSDEGQVPDGINWTYIVPSRPKNLVDQIKMFIALVTFLKKADAHTVFTALPAANTILPLAAAISGGRTKIVTSHHSPVDTHNPALDRLDGIIGMLPVVKAIVSVSKSVEKSLKDKPESYISKSVVIHNALPPEIEQLIKQLASERLPAGGRRRVVVATGRLAKQKNYPVVLRAAVRLPEAIFKIVGDGPDFEGLSAMALEMGVSERVIFLGHMKREDTLRILAEGDIFIQPSLFEGHSLGLVEAAKLGLPLIVSDVPVQVEAIQNADGKKLGMTVGVDDHIALADAIRTLLSNDVQYADLSGKAVLLGKDITFASLMDKYEAIVA